MHQTMLDGNVQQQRGLGRLFGERIERVGQPDIQRIANAQPVGLHLFARRPIRGHVRGQAASHRIDAKREELIELRMKGRQAKMTRAKQVPVEGLQMPNVKNYAVALGDGPVVQSLRANDRKQFVGARPRGDQSLQKRRSVCCNGSCSHGTLSVIRCSTAEYGANKIRISRQTEAFYLIGFPGKVNSWFGATAGPRR